MPHRRHRCSHPRSIFADFDTPPVPPPPVPPWRLFPVLPAPPTWTYRVLPAMAGTVSVTTPPRPPGAVALLPTSPGAPAATGGRDTERTYSRRHGVGLGRRASHQSGEGGRAGHVGDRVGGASETAPRSGASEMVPRAGASETGAELAGISHRTPGSDVAGRSAGEAWRRASVAVVRSWPGLVSGL